MLPRKARVNFSSAVQPPNEAEPIFVTVVGIATSASEVQFINALGFIVVSAVPKSIVESVLAPWKAPVPILVTAARVIVESDVLFWKA